MNVNGERPIGAESIEVAISGDNARFVVLPPEAANWALTVEAPQGAGFLPESTSGVFIGRRRELSELRSLLTGEGSAAVVPSRVQAVHGLGGVGKSRLALHYADHYRSAYSSVWWITAESPESIVTGLARLCHRLCPQWAGTASSDEQAAWAITWLQAHPGWLMIFDNVEDPSHLHPYVGTLAGGHHLATSRRATDWHDISPTMLLGLLPLDEATDLLCTIAFPDRTPMHEEQQQARRLAEVLGCLPLALEQAGAYVHRTGIDLESYRRFLGRVLDKGRGAKDPERTIARIWDRTLTAISRRDPLAVTLLHTMAWLAPDDIPRALLGSCAPDPIALGDSLGELRAYNMIAFTDSGQSINVHRLVQTVLRTRTADPSGTHRPGRQEAEEAVRHALPDGDGPTTDHPLSWERLLPHITALAESTPPSSPASTATADIYYEAAQYLMGLGRDAHTIQLRAAALAQREKAQGETHHETLASRNNLAGAYASAGKADEAVSLYETTLVQCEQTLGETHPDTLASRHNLAYAYHEAGRMDEAIPLYETALAQCEQTLGETHPDTLQSLDSLAAAHRAAGHPERAIPLHRAALAQYEQTLGDTHVETMKSRENLACAYQSAGDLDLAIPLHETTRDQRLEILGETHTDTLISCNNLASAYRSAGRLKDAIELHEATLARCEQVLGESHPLTLASRRNLAKARRQAESALHGASATPTTGKTSEP
ncbi:tetratricopeptide repeat protein [Streptomyces sp. NPDC048330]|uniref:tetratricopeptide repeat protein n=1 Tax=Streptomyces sp. NPDC048330 TaxID=3365533 RepID=UPI0037102FF8